MELLLSDGTRICAAAISALLFGRYICLPLVTSFITQDCLLFAHGTPKFSLWAVLGEGCSSARDSFWDPGASYLLLTIADHFIYSVPKGCGIICIGAGSSVDNQVAICDFPACATSHEWPVTGTL
jgi:hypothetical protein